MAHATTRRERFMIKRTVISLAFVALGVGVAAGVFAATTLTPHDATGSINTAQSVGEGLYICQPSGATVDPICPIDTSGADETIFAASEDLLPNQVAWQKIRLRNSGVDPWDVLSMTPVWTVVNDPLNDCSVLPEAVHWGGTTILGSLVVFGATGPGVTVLGKIEGTWEEPTEDIGYDGGVNDNHPPIESSELFRTRLNPVSTLRSIHVEPDDYDDVLLGIRLPASTPNECLDVTWQLDTTWTVQIHLP